MAVRVHHWDAFTLRPGKGNAAGIVMASQGLNDCDMQAIATAIDFNDTAFVLPSQQADFRLRYFGRQHEVDLCGHATIAAFAALHRQQLLPDKPRSQYTVETIVGVLPIGIEVSNHAPLVIMTQAPPLFADFNGEREALAAALGIAAEDFHTTLPISYGSTGRWTLVVPVKDLNTMQRMQPVVNKFSTALLDMPDASIHPFCLETMEPRACMHARHFSSAASGGSEDTVTGTASGVLGAYYQRFIDARAQQPLIVEQGYEVGREGIVQVWATQQSVRIAGNACFVREIEVQLP